ncbi:MAG TPA: tRNA (adenosine(37)-N6)-threonylcarbamoyltransferase complex transferase subunit TsaD, partial [Candidatus Stercoripulliclostridium merdigallinarum]|nr:tRNA (adenosine(37)-N6)-threonylcarbamoyltransferase complex transferase subunit TsaD [Candidatus Stercoripulliclostridium merdigallinarum]
MTNYYENALKKLNALRDRNDFCILAFESSCDETAVSVTRGREVRSNIISSQIEIHRRFGGVVPEIASRNHALQIDSLTEEALRTAGVTLDDISCIAVTYGAGLLGALLVGVSYAKGLAFGTGKPLIAVNH